MFTFWNVTEIKLKLFSPTKPYFQIPPKVKKKTHFYYYYHFSLTQNFQLLYYFKIGKEMR